MKTGWAVVLGGAVAIALLNAERADPGSTAGSVQELRGAVVPAAGEVLGAAGDALLQVRAEANRQGVNPGAVFQPGPQVTAPPAPSLSEAGSGG